MRRQIRSGRSSSLIAVLFAIAASGGVVTAQSQPAEKAPAAPKAPEPKTEPPEPATTQPAANPPKTPEPQPALPGLDELLDLPPSSNPATADSGQPAPTDEELKRRLSAQEIGDAFKQAITLMGDAADRLETRKDPGLDTQRVQEDVLRKLDELISQLEQNSQQQQQQQQSSSQQKRNDPSDQQAGKQQQQQSQNNQTGNEPGGQPEPPPFQEGALRPALESAPAAWGSLPARIRDMLLQGAGDRFSTTWERATEAYYRRLAEQKPE